MNLRGMLEKWPPLPNPLLPRRRGRRSGGLGGSRAQIAAFRGPWSLSPSEGEREKCSDQEAFTLIELLVVIAIIALLASMIFPVTQAVTRQKMRAVARAGVSQLEVAIESYKAKTGVYPPADTNNPALNPLFYELGGTKLDNAGVYTTKDGSAQINAADVPKTFGTVGGFINSIKGAGDDDAAKAENFLKAIKSTQVLAVNNLSSAPPIITVLGASLDGPIAFTNPTGTRINPWRYNSSTPTNNPKTFDLWIDIIIGGKTNRISNWTKQPQVL
jgi:prepilin-type N-terminal cleavage/methylation domain-containing protein